MTAPKPTDTKASRRLAKLEKAETTQKLRNEHAAAMAALAPLRTDSPAEKARKKAARSQLRQETMTNHGHV